MNDNSGFAVYPSLRGRTAFVSGGASGLGAEFVTQLVESGHLTAEPDPEDRRIRVVRRTARGEVSVRRLADLLAGLEDRWAERVGPARYREFRAVLDELGRTA